MIGPSLWIAERASAEKRHALLMTFDTTRPFTRSEALAAGIRVRDLAGPRFRRLFHGIYLDAAIKLEVKHQATAALRIAPPGSYASHHTAIRLWGCWAPPTTKTHISVATPRNRSVRRGIAAHRIQFPGSPAIRLGIPTSGPEQAFLELAAAGTDLVELVVAGDSLVRRGRTTPEKLIKLADEWRGKGAHRARRAARYVRVGVDSPMESRVRMLIVLAGLPEPVVNLIIRWSDGSWRWRFELSYPDLKVIIEYDGEHHVTDSAQWNADIRRREELERAGWRSVVITAEAFYGSPSDVLDRIIEAMRSRGARIQRRKTPPEWHRYFPGRAA